MFRVIFHLDMDAFYASVEQNDNPALRGQSVIVGAPPTQRGVVCAASYEARKFGVHSAMPSVTARRLCPKGVFVRPRMDHYREESLRIMKLAAATGAVVEQMSIDEAYLDLSAICPAADADAALLNSLPLTRQLKRRIHSERQLTATIGVAANKLLAKIASDHQKPDGLPSPAPNRNLPPQHGARPRASTLPSADPHRVQQSIQGRRTGFQQLLPHRVGHPAMIGLISRNPLRHHAL